MYLMPDASYLKAVIVKLDTIHNKHLQFRDIKTYRHVEQTDV